MKYDYIIMGGGLGGLLTAYILSKEGFSVCVVEKNSKLGGAIQTFSRNGVDFEVGAHYIGAYDEGQILYNYFKYFGLTGRIKTIRLEEDGFDHFNFGDIKRAYKYANGYDNFINTLLPRFPKEKGSLQNYARDLQRMTEDFGLLRMEAPSSFDMNTKYYRTNIGTYLEGITTNKRLQNVLGGSNLLYAGEPHKTPWFIHGLIMNSYIQSAYRFIGGSSQIAEVLANHIISNGGTIKTKSEVKKLLFEKDRIYCVLLRNNEKLYADNFISNIHPTLTLRMLPEDKVKKVYFNRIIGLNNTDSVFTLFIIPRKDSLKYLNYNIYYSRTRDVWGLSNYHLKTWPQVFLLMTQISSYNKEYTDGITIMTYMKYDEVEKWADSRVGNRHDDYESFKEQKTEQLLATAEQVLPGLKQNIESIYAATPLTYRDYLNAPEGSLYGVFHDSKDPFRTHIRPRTKISNLFFTGQNIKIHGVLGVTIASVLTCAELLGMDYLLSKIKRAI